MKHSALVAMAAKAVGAAQRQLPPDLRRLACAVPVHYESAPSDDVLHDGFEPDILGLFTGSAHGREKEETNPAPPLILLYLENIWDAAAGEPDAFREEVRLTYLHEFGHYLGWDEDDLAARGLD